MSLDLTKPTIGHLRHRSCSLDWNRNVTLISNTTSAFAKVSDDGFSQIGSQMRKDLKLKNIVSGNVV